LPSNIYIFKKPLQIKEKIFKLRNKDKVARRVKIFKPDSRLFQVVPLGANGKEANPDRAVNSFGGTKVFDTV
jgi:hydrocephalus-inducing protein